MNHHQIVAVGLAAFTVWMGPAHAENYYKCKDASGTVRFSDRACKLNAVPRSAESPTGEVTPERKAASDARIQRDSALAGQVEAQRRAAEQAAAAAQAQQAQSAKGIEGTAEQARAKKAAATTSVIPSGGTIFVPAGQ